MLTLCTETKEAFFFLPSFIRRIPNKKEMKINIETTHSKGLVPADGQVFAEKLTGL